MNIGSVKGMLSSSLSILMALSIYGCGGGGAGEAKNYSIQISADATLLPLNVANVPPSIGGPYTTTLYVNVVDDAGRPASGAEVGCSYEGGLASGPLYYLDGDPAHEQTETVDGVEVTTPIAYRAITLTTNAGLATFHYHATDVLGEATVRCSVTDPSGTVRSTDIKISVGGQSTGQASQVVFNMQSPNYLFVQGLNGATQVQIQANLVDEAGQLIANPSTGVNNLQVRIVPSASSLADDDAQLRGVNANGQPVSGSSIFVRSINGQAQFSIISGSNPGGIMLEAVTDRSDNNINNGVTEPIYNRTAVSVVTEVPSSNGGSTPLSIETTSVPNAAYALPYGALLEASGGSAPYTWSLLTSSLPTGLSLNSSGVISGIPISTQSGTYTFVAKVTDGAGASKQQSYSLDYTYTPPPVTENTTPPTIGINSLSNAKEGEPYGTVVTASGGATPYSWEASGLPEGLTMTTEGVITGEPKDGEGGKTYKVGITVTSATGFYSSKVVDLMVVEAP